MKSTNPPARTESISGSSLSKNVGAFCLLAALVLPGQVNAATINFSLTWTNTMNSSDTFSGTLSVDSAVFPSSGIVNLADTSANLSVTIPQLGKVTYTMADLTRFDVALTQSAASKLSVGQDLVSSGVLGKAIIFGKVGSAARKNFNQCATEFGVCFNREAQPPVYSLTSMKVLKLSR
jgi:hypothetical protein